MALRVLLADESTTIKKVMQLALQDFAVEVKTVHSGIDVVEVAKAFGPDIIFADVLLPKKSGYQVCMDLKSDVQLSAIPLVLMWSAFMDLDDSQAQASGANQRLEKPFDVENLRQIVLELVPKTRSQRLAHFLQFPDSVTQPLRDEFDKKPPAVTGSSATPQASGATSAATPASTPRPSPTPVLADDTTQFPDLALMPDPPQSSSVLPKSPEVPPERMPIKPLQTPKFAEKVPAPISIPLPAKAKASPPPASRIPASEEVEDEKPAWNMDSFEDADLFSDDASEDVSDRISGANDEEEFKEIRFNSTGSASRTKAPKTSADDEDQSEHDDESVTPLRRRELSAEDRDPWSHQDLSRFKIELPPVSVDDGDMSIQIGEQDIDTNAFQHYTSPGVSKEPAKVDDDAHDFHGSVDDLDSLELEIETDDTDKHSELKTQRTEPLRESKLGLETGRIPQLSSERLEEIIRAQSREIIESVVRKIVPDIAAGLIREELNRLLEEDEEPEPARPMGPAKSSGSMTNKERRPR
jgi:CheY-like chemotaxis protein